VSPLTKILIVLLTISSIFLCGIVVTYVASADNYRQMHDDLKVDRDALEREAASRTKDYNEKKAEMERLQGKLNAEIVSLKGKITKLETTLRNVERERAELQLEVNSWVAVTANFSETTDKQRQLFENTFAELMRVQAQQEKERKELNDLTATLEEKMAVIAMLDGKTKQLLEEKSELQDRLDKLYQPIGKKVVAPIPFTRDTTIARPTTPETQDIELKALIKAVDLKNSMASISIGKAAVVKEGMKFHVTRGDEFICDILIIDVDAEEAVGVLELMEVTKKQPKAGDKIATNL
jgi:hypothetical protein